MAGLGTAAEVASAAGAGLMAVASAPVWGSIALGVGAVAAIGGVTWGTYQLLETTAGTNPDGTPAATSLTLHSTQGPSAWSGGSATTETWYVMPGCSSACPQNLASVPTNVPFIGSWNLVYPTPPTNSVLAGVSGLDIANQEAAAMASWACGPTVGFKNCQMTVTYAGTAQSVEPKPYMITLNSDSGGWTQQSIAAANPAYVNPDATGSLSSIQGKVTPAMLPVPLPPALVAQMANQLWQDAAAQPGYTGLPYSSTTPVSIADVASAPVQATFNDLVNSLPAPAGSNTVPFSTTGSYTQSGSGSGTTTTTTTGSSPSTDMCTADPNSLACSSLGAPPSAPTVPSKTVQIPMTPWSVGSNSGTCPADRKVNVFGGQLSFSFQPICQLATAVQPVVLMLSALAAALIVVAGL